MLPSGPKVDERSLALSYAPLERRDALGARLKRTPIPITRSRFFEQLATPGIGLTQAAPEC